MSTRWKVNDGTQVFIGEKRYEGGDTFTATDAELDEFGSRPYVSEVRQQAAPKAANKAVAAPEPHEAVAAPQPHKDAATTDSSKLAQPDVKKAP